jgi:hypothetical protein
MIKNLVVVGFGLIAFTPLMSHAEDALATEVAPQLPSDMKASPLPPPKAVAKAPSANDASKQVKKDPETQPNTFPDEPPYAAPAQAPQSAGLGMRADSPPTQLQQEVDDSSYWDAHEDARVHIAIDYVTGAFPNYEFNNSTSAGTRKVTQLNSTGAQLEIMGYPIVDYGRLGLGVTGARLATRDTPGFSGLNPSFVYWGPKIVYEMQYWTAQTFVPFAFYGRDRVQIAYMNTVLNQGFEERFTSNYYGAGLGINLNRLEPSVGSRSLVSTGVKKFYLTYSYQYRQGNSIQRGGNHLIGLRFEF